MVLCDNFCTDERGRAGFYQYIKQYLAPVVLNLQKLSPIGETGQKRELNTDFIRKYNLTVTTLMRECIVRHLNIIPTA